MRKHCGSCLAAVQQLVCVPMLTSVLLARLRLGLIRLQLLRSHTKRSMYTYLRHPVLPILSLGDRLFYLLIHFGRWSTILEKGCSNLVGFASDGLVHIRGAGVCVVSPL